MIKNLTRKTVLHAAPAWALTYWQQAIGLRFRPARDEGLIFLFMPARREVIDMWFVAAPLDILALDGEGKVIALATVRPWRLWRTRVRASAIVELPAGTIARTCTQLGDRISLPPVSRQSIWTVRHYLLFSLFMLLLLLAEVAALLWVYVTILK